MHEYERKPRRPGEPRRDEAPPRPQLDVLALQRSAGNQAVGAMLAREPKTEAPAPARAKLTKVGVIGVDSFSQAQRSPGHRETGPPGINIVSKAGDHSVKLQSLLVSGEAVDAELEHLKSGFKLNLTNALVTSYTVASSEGVLIEQWTLHPDVTRTDDGSGGGGGNDQPPRDAPYPG